jgi:hypothetical protein
MNTVPLEAMPLGAVPPEQEFPAVRPCAEKEGAER